ncbi:uncharacterized protein [Diadema setosum]|uniref:uncharacterized protein n=1 Tax=Diadema setosum TaxID=31175 RepID=UPI003B3A522A
MLFSLYRNETVYLSNDWQTYLQCCSLLHQGSACNLAFPCRNGGEKSKDGAICICNPGWTGRHCLTPCVAGRFGQDCSRRCKCGEDADCDAMTGACTCRDPNRCTTRCRSGYWGSTCHIKCRCSEGCQCSHDNGECLCRSRPPRDGLSSPANLYVATQTQAQNACGGECRNGGRCRPALRTCRCRSGYRGRFCEDKCSPGFYGKNCQNRCMCGEAATCLPESGLCLCPDFPTSMFHCTGRCPMGRYGPYCGQQCRCPAGLLCNDISGDCECPEGKVCTGIQTDSSSTSSSTSSTTVGSAPEMPSTPTRRLPVTVVPAAVNPDKAEGTAPSAAGTASSSVSSKFHHASGQGDGEGTSKAAGAPEISLKGGDAVLTGERRGRGETMTLWAVIAVSSLLLLVVASVLVGFLIKRQQQGAVVHAQRSHKVGLEETNVYEIVESTNGRVRSNSKSLDKLAKKSRERSESIRARDSISSITKEIYLLRTSSLSNMSTMDMTRTDAKATELFANWANSLRTNKSNSSKGSASPSPMRSRSNSNPKPSSTTKVTLDNDYDDYAEPVDHVSTLSSDAPSKRALTMTQSDSKTSDRGYQSLYTSSSSNTSSNRVSEIYKPTDDSDYDELDEEVLENERPKQFRFTRSYTYSTPSQSSEYSVLNRGTDRGSAGRRAAEGGKNTTRGKTTRGNTGYSSALKVAENDGQYSHLNRPSQRLAPAPAKRVPAPTLRHDDEDDYDYLEGDNQQPATTGEQASPKKLGGNGQLRQPQPCPDGGYDVLHRQFKSQNDQYESIWPKKK